MYVRPYVLQKYNDRKKLKILVKNFKVYVLRCHNFVLKFYQVLTIR